MNPKNNNRKSKKNKSRGVRSNKTAILLVLFCICIGGLSMVAAKYMNQNAIKNNAVTAKEFYFESDLLDGKEHEIVPTDNKKASVTIKLKNYIDDLRYSETDVKYVIKVTEQGKTDLVSDITIDNETGTIKTGSKNSEDIKISDLKAGKSYTVTATTDNIYKKTLTGTITVSKPDTSIHASVHDESQYIEVTVWTTNESKNINLKYSSSLIPDNTDTKMKDATSSSSGGTIQETSWKANTSHVYRFFKSDESKNYQATVNDEEVTVSEKTQ